MRRCPGVGFKPEGVFQNCYGFLFRKVMIKPFSTVNAEGSNIISINNIRSTIRFRDTPISKSGGMASLMMPPCMATRI